MKSSGPGCRLWMISAPIRMASVTLPGMPMVMSGMRAPPMAALLALSVATTPGSWPVPNFSGSRETFLAVE